jgi:hypothetical protein
VINGRSGDERLRFIDTSGRLWAAPFHGPPAILADCTS